VQALLRTYPGVLDFRISVYETQLARICRVTPEQIKQQLKQLQAFGILDYMPAKDSPQIHYLLNRATAEFLHIHLDQYHARKKAWMVRMKAMVGYIENNSECRSRYLLRYFGETSSADCGVCDVCIRKKQPPLTPKVFAQIAEKILQLLEQPLILSDILQAFLANEQADVQTVLLFLQQEQTIVRNDQNEFRKKK
jgi:ATP-dependent DNA helicase RecQ